MLIQTIRNEVFPMPFDKIKYANEYIKNNYDSLRITTLKGNKDILKEYCKNSGTTINALINRLLYEYAAKNNIQLIQNKE